MEANLKDKILSNNFVEKLRIEMVFDQEAFDSLQKDLDRLSQIQKERVSVNKELMLALYSLPLVVRNLHIELAKRNPGLELTSKLEDAWIELDHLVTECLCD